MTLPPKVQQQLDQAESLMARLAAPEAAPVTATQSLAEVTASEAPTSPPPPADVAPPQPKPQAPDSWEHKYKTLQGIHNRHVGDLKARSETLEQQVNNLTAQLQAKPEEAPGVSDSKDAEVFGTDLVEMVQRVAETMFGTAAKSLDRRLAVIEQRLEGTVREVSRTAEEVFYDRLGAAVPTYAAMNEDAGFLAWLGEVDPIYGVPRQNALNHAAKNLDVDRVAKIFTAYANTLAPVKAAPPASRQLDRQVAPSTTNSAPPRQSGGKPYILAAEVQAFYRDMQQGKFRGREDEAVRTEAVINTALAEGRIVDRRPAPVPA